MGTCLLAALLHVYKTIFVRQFDVLLVLLRNEGCIDHRHPCETVNEFQEGRKENCPQDVEKTFSTKKRGGGHSRNCAATYNV
jgi:hypothetical protein